MEGGLKVVMGGKERDKGTKGQRDKVSPKRRALLAKVHIAKKELGLSEEDYEAALTGASGTGGWIISASVCSDDELERVLEHFEACGWKPKTKTPKRPPEGQILSALRHRINETADGLENGGKRLEGICLRCTGVHRIEWVRDVKKLKAVLAAISGIARREAE